jgi:glucose/arabinose dehydrogenase
MRFSRLVAIGVVLPWIAACSKSDYGTAYSPPPISPSFDYRFQAVPAAAGLGSLMDLQAPPGDGRLFIAVRSGLIRVVENGALVTTPFLDIQTRVGTLIGEDGLISFAFDPNYSANGFVYVHFIEKNNIPFGEIVVERYHISANPNVLEPTGTPVIRIPHPDNVNHYGGRVAFGPDGKLYLSTGDGGGGNNEYGHAMDAVSHLGKMLRLDVSSLPYTIPADNPVWPNAVGRNENWAIGLRNPFRYAFDGNQLYIADVGQGAREEVDVVANAAGLNYGWSIFEGTMCVSFGGGSCSTPGLTAPVYEYDHGNGQCAIIGGYVYRGAAIPELQGTYLFSDLCTGFLRGLTMQNGSATVVQAPNANSGGGTQSYGQDGFGELYVLTGGGQALKIVKP